MPFRTDLVVKENTNTGTWVLQQDLVYEARWETFTVPAGFDTNFASVPRPLWWLVPRYGRHTKAAVVHDWLWHEAREGRFDKCDADGIFRRAMRELRVGFVRRWMMWAAVRLASGEFFSCGPGAALGVALMAIPALVFLAIPVIVVGLFLLAFWVVEMIVWIPLRLFTRKKKVNRPSLLPW